MEILITESQLKNIILSENGSLVTDKDKNKIKKILSVYGTGIIDFKGELPLINFKGELPKVKYVLTKKIYINRFSENNNNLNVSFVAPVDKQCKLYKINEDNMTEKYLKYDENYELYKEVKHRIYKKLLQFNIRVFNELGSFK